MQSIGDQRADIVEPERRQHNLLDPRSSFADRFQRPQKRVRGTDLIVPVGADQHQVPHLRVRDQTLEEVERCCIQPLQIIEEQRERVLRPGERAEEAPEHQLEAVLRILRGQLWSGWLLPDDELHLRDEIDDQLAVCPDRLRQDGTPLFHLRFALDEDLIDQSLEGLCQCRIRNVALILVELAYREEPARRNKRLVQLVHHRGFTDARITGYEHELWRTLRHHPVEGCEQGIDLVFSPVQLLRDQQ